MNREFNKTNELSTLSLTVSEEIESKNLHNFLRTSILNSDIVTSKNSHYYFYYNLNTKIYEIIVFDIAKDTVFAEPFLLLDNYKTTDDKVKVFIRDNYFIITQKNRLLILKKAKNIEKEELTLYIKKVYKIINFEIIDDKIDLSGSQNNNTIQSKQFFPLYPKKSFYFFIMFCMAIVFILSLSLYMISNKDNNISKNITTKKNDISNIANLSIVPQALDLLTYLELKDLQIKKIYYINNQLKTTLSHKNKSPLLSFINKFNKNISLTYLKYDETKNTYILDVSLEY